MFSNMRLGVQLTEHCDLACRHCATSSSPRVTSKLDRGLLRDLLQELKAIDPGAEVGFTGGEVFRARDLLYYGIDLVRDLELRYSIVTNGSWAIDEDDRRKVLESILDVRRLGLSSDVYHRTAVPARAIGLAVREAVALGIEAAVRYTYVEGEDLEQVYADLGLDTAELRERVQFSAIMAIGRATRLSTDIFPTHSDQEPCLAASVITIRSTGDIVGCCGEAMYLPGPHDLHHGHLGSETLTDVIDARRSNNVLQALRTVGARQLAELAGLASDAPGDRVYVKSPCGSCRLLFRNQDSRDRTARTAAALCGRVNSLRALYFGEV